LPIKFHRELSALGFMVNINNIYPKAIWHSDWRGFLRINASNSHQHQGKAHQHRSENPLHHSSFTFDFFGFTVKIL
jgi:hypothetical protein